VLPLGLPTFSATSQDGFHRGLIKMLALADATRSFYDSLGSIWAALFLRLPGLSQHKSSLSAFSNMNSCEEAVEKIKWHSMRWKIEVFHKILKSGCRPEDARLRTADRLANLVTLFCIMSWGVLWLAMLARTAPETPPTAALTKQEIEILDQMVSSAGNRQAALGSLNFYLIKLARLGGCLARTSDLPPEIRLSGAASTG